MTTEQRGSHPYHMHDAILAQPEAFVRAVERNEGAVRRVRLQDSLLREDLAGWHRHLAPRRSGR